MGFEDADLVDDEGGGGGKATVSVSCSICLEDVTDFGDRAWAKLLCGHHFHLDCIGSAFNVKGVMQCPNCRTIEKGQWLYADGGRPYPEINIDDLVNDEDLYDLSYPESSMWCPFGGFTRFSASFDEREFPTTPYHDLLGQHAIFTEHPAVSSAGHLCPYIAYIQPVHPSSSSSAPSAGVADGPTYNNQWNSQSVSNEIPNSYAFPTMDVHYHTLFPTSSSRIGGVDLPSMPSIMPRRAPRTNADIPRSGSYVHPFLVGQSSATRAPSSLGSAMIHPYPGSAARARERSQALQAYFQQSNVPAIRTPITPASRRPNSQAHVGQVASTSDQSRAGVYFFPTSTVRSIETDNSMLNGFHQWERDPHAYSVDPDPGWGPFHQTGGGSGAGFRQRHSSEWNPSHPSQSHYRS